VHVAALIPAAGRGRRMAQDTPKVFLPLGGIPLLAHTLQKFEASPIVRKVLLLVPDEGGIRVAEEIVREFGFRKVFRVIPGGPERQDSVYRGLKELPETTEIVVIHDGARPFVPVELIERIAAEARIWKCVVAALPVRDTIKEVAEGGQVLKTLDRRLLWEIQTPQGFAYPVLLDAHEKAREQGFSGTDDAVLVERLGAPVKVLLGSRGNIKITAPEDLALGEAILELSRRETGQRPSPRAERARS
jgi:2-C-methyl-D-erythritol 4-phosphate cytidylyltransferase